MNRTKTLGWLVGAAALLFAGCSSEDGVIEEQTPQQPQQTQATIHVTVGAGITDGEATTRSTVDYTGGTRTLQFTSGDKLYVWGKASHSIYASGAEYYGYVLAGMLALDAIDPDDPTKATFSGDLSVYEALVDGDYDDETGDWNFIYGVTYPDANRLDYLPYYISSDDPLSSCDYVRATLIHEGTESQVTIDDYKDISLPTYDCAATVEALMTTGLIVTGNYYAGTKSFTLGREDAQPIVNCTIAGLEGSTDYQFVLKKGAAVATSVGWTTDAGGTASFAFISRESGSAEWTLDVTKGGSTVGTISLGSGEMALASKVYNVSRKWTGSAFVKYVNLTGQTGDVTVKDGYTVEGTLSGHQLLIADGATVTLSGASVTGPEGTGYGAIRCLGNATIILADGTENTAQSGKGNKYAAVSVPDGKTLTINGGMAGTLVADARVDGDLGLSRAGIGAGDNISGGDVTIAGGAVTAYGINNAAGIGGGYNSNYGNVTITGGNVSATGGSYGGAGIGSNGGYGRNYGNIRIEGGNVTATGGSDGGAGIGSGKYGFCGDITITGGTVEAIGGDNGGAGIGGGVSYSCGNIRIEGGSVTATGKGGGAGIGSGKSGSVSGNITITDGADYIYVHKYGNCRCIGKGESGKCGTVSIDGLSITDYMYDDEFDVEEFPTFPNFNLTLDEDCDYKTSETWTLTHK